MNRAAIEELFAFTDFCWQQHEKAIRPLGDGRLCEPVTGSGWPALRDAFMHINWAYERWLSDPHRVTDHVSFEIESVRSWDDIETYRQQVRGRCRESIDSISDGEVSTLHEIDIDGEIHTFSSADIIAHVLLHEREHHGDISTLLFQMGIEPPIVEYRFYVAEARV